MKVLTSGSNARNGYYRRAIRDALSHSNRKPFQCGGLKAYDQLIAVEAHLHTRQQQLGTDPYLAQLHRRVKAALQSSSELAGSVRQAHTCLRQLEHYLAQVTLQFGILDWGFWIKQASLFTTRKIPN